jgi:pimeloyl-ACP methyl ester carboxylesterase
MDAPLAADTTPPDTVVSCRGMRVFVRNRGDGSPLLMINGLGANVEMWGAAEDRLSTVARTIVFDAPGSGRSSTPHWPQSIPALANLVRTLLDRLDHERVDVLGFSLGGLIAQQLAHDAPDRVRRMALVGTSCGWGSMPGTPEALALIAMPLRYYSRLLSQATTWLLSPADQELVRRTTALTDARLRYPPSFLGYAGQFWAGALWSSLPWLPSVKIPTLVIHGEDDHLVPSANAIQLTRLLPESRLHILPDEGHLVLFDPESPALSLLEDFFSSAALTDSESWATGTAIDGDNEVEAAFATCDGAQPLRALSAMFRRLYQPPSTNGARSS